MHRFAFIIHPIDVCRDAARRFPVARYLPESAVSFALRHWVKPGVLSKITGVRSLTGAETEGWFIGCPLTPKHLLTLPTEVVYEKLIQCGKIAEDLGADILGLGALTAVVGDGGVTIANNLRIGVTTGNSYTVATAIEGARRGAVLMGTPMNEATIAVIGASGSIGRTCALLLARDARAIHLVGRNIEKLLPVAREIEEFTGSASSPEIHVTADVAAGLRDADVVVAVTSSADVIVLPKHLKRGAVVCDVARPRDVSPRVARERPDVLVIEGGVVAVPPETDFHFNFGFPPHTAYACMAETMLLALENRPESFTLGKSVSTGQVTEMQSLAARHGFRLAGFRAFERAVDEEKITAVRRAAGRGK